MAQDLVMRLILENKQLNDKLASSQRSLNRFQQQAKKSGDGVSFSFADVAKKAGGIGIALAGINGGKEIFDSIINSSQTLSDGWNNNIGSMKDTVNEFFYAVGNGDFSNFQNGLTTVFDNAKKVKEALDQLGNTKISFDYVVADIDEKIANKREIITDSESSKKDKELALTAIDELLEQKKVYINNIGSVRENTLKTLITQGTNLSRQLIEQSDVDKVLQIDISDSNTRDSIKEQYSSQYAEYKDKLEKLIKRQRGVNTNGYTTAQLEERNKSNMREKEQLSAEYKDAIMFNQILVKWSDEELINAVALVKEQKMLNVALSAEERTRNKLAKSINKKEGGNSSVINQTQEKRETLKYNSMIQPNSDIWGNKNIVALSADLQMLQNKFNNSTTDFERDALRIKIESLKKTIEVLQTGKEGKGLGADIRGVVTQNESNVIPTINNEAKAGTLDYLMQVSSMMGALSGVSDNAGSAWLTYSANVISGVVSMLPALASVFGITAALGIAEQSKIPFPLNIIAMGASAVALAATIASLPKFESGGIVGGNSFVGDNVIARVNSGEMILNKGQQANLFKVLNNGGTNSVNNNSVQFRISGSDRIGTLNNYNKKTSKIR